MSFLGRASWHRVRRIPQSGGCGWSGGVPVPGGHPRMSTRRGAPSRRPTVDKGGPAGLAQSGGPSVLGGCGCRSSLCMGGVHSWASSCTGGKRRPTVGRASTAWKTAWSVAPGYAPGRRGDGSAVLRPEICGQSGLPGLPAWVAPGHSDVSKLGLVRRRMQRLGVPGGKSPPNGPPTAASRQSRSDVFRGRGLTARAWVPGGCRDRFPFRSGSHREGALPQV